MRAKRDCSISMHEWEEREVIQEGSAVDFEVGWERIACDGLNRENFPLSLVFSLPSSICFGRETRICGGCEW